MSGAFGILNGIISFDVIQNTEQVFYCFCTEHGNACFLEIRDSLEHW